MFGMIYRKRNSLSLRNPSLMIWTLLFPLGLATLFYLAFGNLDQERQFHVIPVALVSEGEESGLAKFLGELSEGEEALLQVTKTDREKAGKSSGRGRGGCMYSGKSGESGAAGQRVRD